MRRKSRVSKEKKQKAESVAHIFAEDATVTMRAYRQVCAYVHRNDTEGWLTMFLPTVTFEPNISACGCRLNKKWFAFEYYQQHDVHTYLVRAFIQQMASEALESMRQHLPEPVVNELRVAYQKEVDGYLRGDIAWNTFLDRVVTLTKHMKQEYILDTTNDAD